MATSSKATGPGSGVRLVIVESPSKAKTISGYLGDGYIVESSVGHIRDLPRGAADVPAKYKGEPWARLGVNTENGFEPLYVDLPGEAGAGRQAQVAAGRRRRALPGDRRGPRGRGHRLAPAGDAQAQGPGQADGLPRDHPGRDPGGRREPAGAGRQPGRRPGDPPHPGPAVRLRGLAGAVEEGHAEAVGRPRAVGRHPDHRAARTRADGASGPAPTGVWTPSMAPTEPDSQAFKSSLATVDGRRLAAGRDFDPATGAIKAGTDVLLLDEDGARTLAAQLQGGTGDRQLGGGEALHPQALPAVHDLDPAAGGRPQARLQLRAHHAHRAAAVRERLHHLHADRLHDAERDRAGGGPGAGPRAVRAGVRAGRAAAVHPQGEERPGGARGHPAGRGDLPHPRPGRPARSTATSSGCTS